MPGTVRTARFIMTLEVAFGLVGIAILVGTFFATFDAMLFLLLAYSAAMLALTGWLLSRFQVRRRWVLWAVVAYEAYVVASRFTMLVIDADLTWLRILHPNTLMPAAIVVMLLLPAARRWFGSWS